jgi:homoserine O-acetyltransferase
MCCGAEHSPWQIGISEGQRQAIYADPKWRNGDYMRHRDPPVAGLSVARQMAMITYRSHKAYADKFGREEIAEEHAGNGQGRYFEVERYLRYQGEKFQARFDPLSYIAVTRMMDTHDVGRGRGGIKQALSGITQPVLIISVDSDILYPPCEQDALHRMIPSSEKVLIRSDNGHDGFLLDQEVIEKVSKDFILRRCPKFKAPNERTLVEASLARPWGAIATHVKANL